MVLPTSYFPTILQYSIQIKNSIYKFDGKEHFIKQSFRNRCEIYGANGKLSLVVPLKKWNNHTPTENIEISFEDNWQNIHWKSIESAYRASPFFEFYEDEIKPLLFLEEKNLLKRNLKIIQELNNLLGFEDEIAFTTEFEKTTPDYRKFLHPKKSEFSSQIKFPNYLQVFEAKMGFIPNLSILDLIFNLGPETRTYLKNLEIRI